MNFQGVKDILVCNNLLTLQVKFIKVYSTGIMSSHWKLEKEKLPWIFFLGFSSRLLYSTLESNLEAFRVGNGGKWFGQIQKLNTLWKVNGLNKGMDNNCAAVADNNEFSQWLWTRWLRTLHGQEVKCQGIQNQQRDIIKSVLLNVAKWA